MSRHGNKKGFLIGTLFGGLVGGMTALLFAPKAGHKLRKDIARKCCEVSDKTQDLVCGVSDQAKQLVEKAREIAEDAKDAAQALVKELKSK